MKGTVQRGKNQENDILQKHKLEEIKKDKELMQQLKMDAAQEEKIDTLTENITVSDKEISDYRDMI